MDWYLLAWRRYAEFNGRSRRKEYWMFALFNCLIGWSLFIAGLLLKESEIGVIFLGSYWIYSLAALTPAIAVYVRRMHDTGRSGWWWLIALIPLVGGVILIVLLATDSEPGTNKYGPNPKPPEQAAGLFYGSAGFSTMGPSAPPQPLAGDSGYRLCKSCGSRMAVASSFCSKCGAHV